MATIRAAIVGYGNLGKSVEKLLAKQPDMELAAVFSRRETLETDAPVLPVDDFAEHTDKFDVALLCLGSATDIPEQAVGFARHANTVDTYDNHRDVPRHRADMDAAAKLPPEKLVVVTTGTQGESMAGLSRMARREHRQVNLGEGDTVLFSSSLVPGNEEAVFGVMNSLSQMGVEVITGREANIHVSGHGYSGELLFIYNAVRPRNAMPVHGEWRHLRANKALAVATGVPENNVVLAQNGVVVDLIDGQAAVVGQVPVGNLYVDGLSTGDVGDTVLADRTALAEDGFIVATVVVDPRTGRPVSKPQIIGKGFTDEPGALAPVVELVENALWDLAGEGETDPYRLAQAVRRTVGRWVSDKWRRKPMIVPTVITSAVAES